MTHPTDEQISAWLDGDATEDVQARITGHLPRCAACQATVTQLRRVADQAQQLIDEHPPHDLWPGLRAGLRTRNMRRSRLLVSCSTAAVIAIAAWFIHRELAAHPTGDRYLLLLHEQTAQVSTDAAAEAAVVAEYRAWFEQLAARGHGVGGDKLDDSGGALLQPDGTASLPGGARIGGFFVIRATSEAQAIALGRTCPHLRHGGSVEVRRIIET